MNYLISVIVPIYKVEKYLEKCIESIVNQTYKNLEIILVDDGSPDLCPIICDKWRDKDERIIVFHKENGGLSDARNYGLKRAKGDFISFIDSDDWITLDMYEKMLNEIEKVDADICVCGIINEYSNNTYSEAQDYIIGDSELFLERLYDGKFPPSAWNKIYRKELLKDFQYPVGKICEDSFTIYYLLNNAKKIVQIPYSLYHYRIREGSIMTNNFSLRRMDEEEAWRMNYQFVKDNFPNLRKKAYDFYLQKVFSLIQIIPKNSKFQKEYCYLKNILNRKFFYIVFFSQLPIKYRLYFIANYFKI